MINQWALMRVHQVWAISPVPLSTGCQKQSKQWVPTVATTKITCSLNRGEPIFMWGRTHCKICETSSFSLSYSCSFVFQFLWLLNKAGDRQKADGATWYPERIGCHHFHHCFGYCVAVSTPWIQMTSTRPPSIYLSAGSHRWKRDLGTLL